MEIQLSFLHPYGWSVSLLFFCLLFPTSTDTSQQNSESWLQTWQKLLWSGSRFSYTASQNHLRGCNLTCCVFESTRCHGRFAKFRCVKYTYAFKENDFCTSSHDFWDTSSSHDFCGMTQFEFVIFSLAIFLWGIGWATSWFHFWNEIKREQNMTNELVLGQFHYSN